MTAALVAAVTFAVPAGAQTTNEAGDSPGVGGLPPRSIGIQLLDAPVERRQDPRASRSIIDHMGKGDVIERRIQVVSTYEETLDVPVYAEAATLRDGEFIPDGKGSHGNVLTEWMTVEPNPLRIEPGGRGIATVTVAVPRDAPDGEFYAIVFAEAPPQGDTIRSINRAGVRLYISVGTGLEPGSDFEVDSLVAVRGDQGEPQVRVNVTNTGERALDLRGELTLSNGPGALSAGPFSAQGVTTLAIGRAGQMFVPLDEELPNGPWLATFVARSGTLERTAEATITFPEATGEADPAEAEETGAEDGVDSERVDPQRRMLLSVAALLILLAIGALYLMLLWKRREEDEDDGDEPIAAGAASAAGGDEGS